jgi:hypothetical protein
VKRILCQDALLRDARFIVGIRMHTKGMRGTSDPTYGYYTMGKLMILKLREDYRVKMGARFSLRDFHDTFIKLGPLPLPLVRKAMLSEVGRLF